MNRGIKIQKGYKLKVSFIGSLQKIEFWWVSYRSRLLEVVFSYMTTGVLKFFLGHHYIIFKKASRYLVKSISRVVHDTTFLNEVIRAV